METAGEDRVGVLIVRARLEPGSDPPLRIRITSRLDIDQPVTVVAETTSVDKASRDVRDWLIAFLTD